MRAMNDDKDDVEGIEGAAVGQRRYAAEAGILQIVRRIVGSNGQGR
jgi:hypothetical protein